MPKEVTVIRCDCRENGILHEIAKTEISWGFACGDGGEQTFFYECDDCKKIFSRVRLISGNFVGNDPDSYSAFRSYKGKLTKIEIIDHAGKCFGGIYSFEEDKIIAKRKQGGR
jgi:hypothetical protein